MCIRAEIFDEGVRVEFARDVPCLSFRENLRKHFTFVSVKLYYDTKFNFSSRINPIRHLLRNFVRLISKGREYEGPLKFINDLPVKAPRISGKLHDYFIINN